MDWQEKERENRITEQQRQETERKEILNLWNKLIKANNELLPFRIEQGLR